MITAVFVILEPLCTWNRESVTVDVGVDFPFVITLPVFQLPHSYAHSTDFEISPD